MRQYHNLRRHALEKSLARRFHGIASRDDLPLIVESGAARDMVICKRNGTVI
jgi:hypothetical protein